MSSGPRIQDLCSADIAAITQEKHVFGAEHSIISIYLELHNRSGLRMRVGPGGWGLSVGSDPPRAYDMDQYGRVEIQPADQILARAVGPVATVWSVCVAGEPLPVGVRWLTSTGTDIVVYCYDDTFLVAPPDELELDDVTFTEVC